VRLELVPLDVAMLTQRVIEGALPTATEAGVTLTSEISSENLAIFGDRKRLEQVVTNLVGNAIKFTPAGGNVHLSVLRQGRDVVLRVRDTGLGISPEALSSVFEVFRQETSMGTTRGGLGLGLYIVRHLVELHGGTVAAESDGEGRGACFVVHLPWRNAEIVPDRGNESHLPDETRGLEGIRILVVDDEPDARELMSMMLVHKGAHVAVADTAATALSMFESYAPDVVVSDIGLPGEDGYSLIQRLRALNPNLPAVAVSGFAAHHDAALAIASGFDMHVAKPVEPARLEEAVRELFDKRRNRTRG
jgi:CheY-like chemotaxis protein